MKNFDYTTYLSPLTWRYGSEEMRKIWSEQNKRTIWRTIWIALAKAQFDEGLVSQEELDDLISHQNDVDIDKAHEIEKDIKHDLMAEIQTYASQATKGGGKIHLGATSMDIEDNADALRIQESLGIIEEKLTTLIKTFATKIEEYKDLPCMAYTHLQPAEPTTLGLRFCLYAQDLVMDLDLLKFAQKELKGKGLKGAVGTSASYVKLLDEKKAKMLEEKVMKELDISAVTIASQTAPRKFEYFVSAALSSIAQSLYKFAFDVRLMQSPGFGEWQEPFAEKQVGSSAMPFKRNPIKSEQICSLARLVMQLATVTGENAAHMGLERTLDDSANRRIILPEIFLATDDILQTATKIVTNLVINTKTIEKNLAQHGSFAATESLMMIAVKQGANRQIMHEVIRENALKAYDAMQETGENPLEELLLNDRRIGRYVEQDDIKKNLDPKKHLGLAVQMCQEYLKKLNA